MTKYSLDACKVMPIKRITDERGDIGVVEAGRDIPFVVRRLYYSYNTPNDVVRGGHAHKNLHQFLFAIAGGFDLTLDDGTNRRTFRLDRPDEGIYICPMVWRDLSNFLPNTVCLVMASEYYDENDYIRNYDEFLKSCRVKDAV